MNIEQGLSGIGIKEAGFTMETNKQDERDFYRAENILSKKNLDYEIQEEIESFLKKLKGRQEDETILEARLNYFKNSLKTLMILNGNKLLNPGYMDTQKGKLNNFQAMDKEQQLTYDKNLLVMLKKLRLMENKSPASGELSINEKNKRGVKGLIDIRELNDKKLLEKIDIINEIDIFISIRGNPEARTYIEKLYREQKENIMRFIENYHPDDLELFNYGKIGSNDLKMVESEENLKKAA